MCLGMTERLTICGVYAKRLVKKEGGKRIRKLLIDLMGTSSFVCGDAVGVVGYGKMERSTTSLVVPPLASPFRGNTQDMTSYT